MNINSSRYAAGVLNSSVRTSSKAGHSRPISRETEDARSRTTSMHNWRGRIAPVKPGSCRDELTVPCRLCRGIKRTPNPPQRSHGKDTASHNIWNFPRHGIMHGKYTAVNSCTVLRETTGVGVHTRS